MKNNSGILATRFFLVQAFLLHALLACSSWGQVHFDLQAYRFQAGLEAIQQDDQLTITWEGRENTRWKLVFSIVNRTPTIQSIAYLDDSNQWQFVTQNLTPVIRVVSGRRRVTQQQTKPLEALGIPLTEETLDEIKWDAFWDAPLYVDDKPPPTHRGSIPASEPFANHPGMPRKQKEIIRATAAYSVDTCYVRTNGNRLELKFDGVRAGLFNGHLQFDIIKGSNLLRQTLIAKTEHESVAFKYDSGVTGMSVTTGKIVWRDLAKNWQEYHFGAPSSARPTTLKTSNRVAAAELVNGAIAIFPPPHSFYWARETEENLGYNWFQKGTHDQFSFGIRQAELEQDHEFYHNFALYNARPGTWQEMPAFIYLSTGSARGAIDSVLRFTHGDKFKPLPDHKVMGHHYHVGLVKRLKELGGFHQWINDIETMKSVGVNIFSVIDGVRGPARHDKGEGYLDALNEYYQAARQQSDHDFLVMPNDENSTGGRRPFVGGHYDLLHSRPVFWRPWRDSMQPVITDHPKYGKVYNLKGPMDLIAMCQDANTLISMPHPNTKGSTGYPKAILDTPWFKHTNYYALGYRWGMGIDGSERRLGEYRFLNLWDQTNHHLAQEGVKPKYALAISEARSDYGERGKPPHDDVYGMAPVNYLKIDQVPTIDDMSSITNALKKGEYFVTSGEVLIPEFEIIRAGTQSKFKATIQWTFPLEFIELIWSDGQHIDRKIIPQTNLTTFGEQEFEISFDATEKKWIRFAVWDIAKNGAFVQPIWLDDE